MALVNAISSEYDSLQVLVGAAVCCHRRRLLLLLLLVS
jgi:hypothetical protein